MVKETETHTTIKHPQTDIEIRMQIFSVSIDIIVIVIIKGDIDNLRYLLPCFVGDILYCRYNIIECLRRLHCTLSGINILERQEATVSGECRMLCRCLVGTRIVIGMVGGVVETFLPVRLTEYGRDEFPGRRYVVTSRNVDCNRFSLGVFLFCDGERENAFRSL